MSSSPRVSLTCERQKRKPTKVSAEKYQIEPYTFKLELIMNSKVRDMRVKLRNWAPEAKPDVASIVTSGMYNQATLP